MDLAKQKEPRNYFLDKGVKHLVHHKHHVFFRQPKKKEHRQKKKGKTNPKNPRPLNKWPHFEDQNPLFAKNQSRSFTQGIQNSTKKMVVSEFFQGTKL